MNMDSERPVRATAIEHGGWQEQSAMRVSRSAGNAGAGHASLFMRLISMLMCLLHRCRFLSKPRLVASRSSPVIHP